MREYVVIYKANNYTLGAKVKSTQIDKIICTTRIDSNHTLIAYKLNDREIDSTNKILSLKGVKIFRSTINETELKKFENFI